MRHRLLLILFLSCIRILSSCSENIDQENMKAAGEEIISIRLNVEEAAVSKSLPQVSEALVKDASIFVYDTEGNLYRCMYAEQPGSELTVEIDQNREYMLYIIANAGDLTNGKDMVSESAMESLYWTYSPSIVVREDGVIPMSGKMRLTPEMYGERLDFPLTRVLSKFRFIVDKSQLDEDVEVFEVIEVRIRNLNSRVGFFSTSKAGSTDEIIGNGPVFSGNDLEGIYTEGIDIYLPENAQGDLLSGNTDERTHIPPEPYDGLCTLVEFTVKYKSVEHYDNAVTYRYYLHDGRRLDNFDLLRNTMYTCRTVFTGSGIGEESWRIDISGMKDLVTSVKVSPDDITFMYDNESVNLTAEVLPLSAENRNIVWESSDPDVAEVTENGVVTPEHDGTCFITATAEDIGGVSDTAWVNVIIDGKYVKILDMPSTLYDDWTISYESFPEGVPEFYLTTVSGDSRGATLSDDGRIIVDNPDGISGQIGYYSLRATLHGVSDYKNFRVEAGYIQIAEPEEIYVGFPVKMELRRLAPSDMNVTWSSSDSTIADITEDGTLMPLRTGQCVLTATSETKARDSIVIDVQNPIEVSLTGEYRIVNTSGIAQEDSPWDQFSVSTKIDIVRKNEEADLTMTIYDDEGNLSGHLKITDDGTASIISSEANGTYTIRIQAWNNGEIVQTENIDVEVYQLLEYEVGLVDYDILYGKLDIYMITYSSRWTLSTWNTLNEAERTMLMDERHRIVKYVTTNKEPYNIGSYDEPIIFISGYYCGIGAHGNAVYDLENTFSPLSGLAKELGEMRIYVNGTKGVYYKMTPSGPDCKSYVFVLQKRNQFFNRDEWLEKFAADGQLQTE